MNAIELTFGAEAWRVMIPPTKLAPLSPLRHPEPLENLRASLFDALDHPLHLDFPFKRALTPDDHITVVVDDELPHAPQLIEGLLSYLAGAGVSPESVTLLLPEGGRMDRLGEMNVRIEIHNPDDRNRLSYLSTTSNGRRVYLNRRIVDADQSILLSCRRFDAQHGFGGGSGSIYPLFADRETQMGACEQTRLSAPDTDDRPIKTEADEIAWLVGTPILIQLIEDAGEELHSINSGFLEAAEEGDQNLIERWKSRTNGGADLVIACVGSSTERQTTATWGRAINCAARVLETDGSLVLLSGAMPELGAGLETLRRCDDVREAMGETLRLRPNDYPAALAWLDAANRGKLFVASGWSSEVIEEMFATPMSKVEELQRLIEGAHRVIIIPDADKAWVAPW